MKPRKRKSQLSVVEDGPAPVDPTRRPDGFVEVIGRFPDGGLLIQGWATGAVAGATAMVVETGDRTRYAAIVATFRRDDLPPGAAGVLAVLPDVAISPATVRRCHLRLGGAWRRLDVFDGRTLLPDGDATGHLRDMLAMLENVEEDRRTLRRLAAPRFSGHDTVNGSALPVRAAVDLAVRVPGTGIWIAGWLLDPTGRVDGAWLGGPGWSAPLDAAWIRSPRRDVSEGFATDPRFADALAASGDRHGFAAFVPEPPDVGADAPDTPVHLALTVADDTILFLPVGCVPPTSERIRRILSSVDPDDPAAEALIARHVAPIVRAAQCAVGGPTTAHDLGPPLRDPRLSVIVPVVDGREDVDLTLARLSVDAEFAGVEVVVVATAAAHPRLARAVRAAAGFYRMPVRLVLAPQARDAFDAIAAALPHARADRLLVLSTAVVPGASGWLGDLERAAMRSGRPALASPTLLYEDHSVRFAGTVLDEGADPVAQFVGYPADWLAEGEPRPVAGGSIECALVPKAWLVAVADRIGGRFLAPERKTLDLCLRLGANGGACIWVPSVRLVAVDEAPRTGDEPWRRSAAIVDRLTFAAARSEHAAASRRMSP
jgi:O-antigen biosynthesis protein